MPIECLLDRGRERKGGRASLQSAKTSRIYFVLAWRLLSHCAKIWNKAERAARRPKVCRCTMYLYAYRSTDSTSRNDCTYPVSCILHGRWSSPCIARGGIGVGRDNISAAVPSRQVTRSRCAHASLVRFARVNSSVRDAWPGCTTIVPLWASHGHNGGGGLLYRAMLLCLAECPVCPPLSDAVVAVATRTNT